MAKSKAPKTRTPGNLVEFKGNHIPPGVLKSINRLIRSVKRNEVEVVRLTPEDGGEVRFMWVVNEPAEDGGPPFIVTVAELSDADKHVTTLYDNTFDADGNKHGKVAENQVPRMWREHEGPKRPM